MKKIAGPISSRATKGANHSPRFPNTAPLSKPTCSRIALVTTIAAEAVEARKIERPPRRHRGGRHGRGAPTGLEQARGMILESQHRSLDQVVAERCRDEARQHREGEDEWIRPARRAPGVKRRPGRAAGPPPVPQVLAAEPIAAAGQRVAGHPARPKARPAASRAAIARYPAV